MTRVVYYPRLWLSRVVFFFGDLFDALSEKTFLLADRIHPDA